MVDRIDVVKDVSIAFLSTSSLLLTLVLAFISPSAVIQERFHIRMATYFLYVTALFSACTLGILTGLVGRKSALSAKLRVFFVIQLVAFVIGLMFIAEAIINLT